MVRFDRQRSSRAAKPPPDYLSRAIQQRLLAMVGMLLLVLIAMQQAGQPENWSWMFGHARDAANAQLPPDVAVPVTASAAERALIDSPDVNTTRAGLDGWLPNIDRSLLESIHDDTYFRREENAVWFHLIAQLRTATAEQIQQTSLGLVSYLQLYRQTSAYRGRIVNLEGTVRRAHRLSAADNDQGISGYWQCWLFPRHARNPIVLYALDMAPGFEGGMEIEQPIRCAGLVYKRWPYENHEQLTVAPVVLAKQVELVAAPPLELAPDWAAPQRRQWPLMVLITALAAIGVTFALYRYTERSATAKVRQQLDSVIVRAPEISEPEISEPEISEPNS